MNKERYYTAKLNILIAILCQLINIVCGFIVPQLLITSYGSEAYGATSSIGQFLAYISLLEGGIAGVTRAALYKPLSENNYNKISGIMSEIRYFFRIIGYVFAAYVIILAFSYKTIAKVQVFDNLTTFLMVIVISISTFGQYFIGISNSVLLQADQKQYVTNLINIFTIVINTFFVILLVYIGCNLLLVKLVSGIIFFIRPVVLSMYVKNNYKIDMYAKRDKTALNQKWTGLGQHIAYFLHMNTDIAVLTLLGNLKLVAIYSVYQMVVSSIQSFAVSFTAGMEALFGEMWAKKEVNLLKESFSKYETLISIVAIIFFSCTAVLIVPFVMLYTKNVTDANYIQPIFGFLLVFSAFIFCIRLPYHSMVIAAGHFKQTRYAAYGEAFINILLSLLLVLKYDLNGIALGTFIAVLFRFVFYIIYLSKNIFYRALSYFIKRLIVNIISFILIIFVGKYIIDIVNITNYITWFFSAIVITIISTISAMLINFIFYFSDAHFVVKKIFKIKS